MLLQFKTKDEPEPPHRSGGGGGPRLQHRTDSMQPQTLKILVKKKNLCTHLSTWELKYINI